MSRSPHSRPPGRRRSLAVAGALLGLALLGLTTPAAAQPRPDVQRGFAVHTLSARPDMVTGGDVLLRIDVPATTGLSDVRVTLDDTDVTGRFLADPALHTLTGLVSGLRVGSNRLAVATTRHSDAAMAQVTLVNHPVTGPVFSGPQQQPFICETHAFAMPVVGGTLGPARDESCSIATRVDYFYRTTSNRFAAWPTGATTYPTNLAWTTTTLGARVPYIVRMETGTVNRSIYQTTILHDPLREPTPTWSHRPAGWNGRLIYTFGGGCTGGWYRQGRSTGGVTDHFMLSSGYAVASASLNVFGNNCQEITSAETMMMVKERFVEAYGPVQHTQGFGCSGGSYQQHQIGDNYPGLLDGIIPGCSFPEVGVGTVVFITDAWLIHNYFGKLATVEFTAEQQRAVTGFAVYNTAPNVASGARRIDPRVFCDASLPVELRYDPVANPTGARCDVYDHTVNAYGTDPRTGFARRPLDNVGVQYGLAALNAGVISPAQFLDLNERIGGFDNDANIVPRRSEGDPIAITAAYATGRVTHGGGGLADIPIIDYRAYNDDTPSGDIHVRYHTFSMRERLVKANGDDDNYVSLLEDNRYGLYSTASPMLRHAILAMDRWITAIHADTGPGTAHEKVVRNKPTDLTEGCNTRAASPTFVAQPLDRDPASTCERLYPSASFPREVAGGPVTADVVKCHLKEVDPADYAATFTPAQWDRLRAIFPAGVCDWSRPGFQQRAPQGTWLSYGNGR